MTVYHPPFRSLGTPRSRSRRPAALLAALLLAACGDVPTGATATTESAAPLVLPSFSVATTDLMTAMLADITGRVIPALPDGSAREALAGAFDVLALALAGTPDAQGAMHDPRASLNAATAALAVYAAAVASDPEAPAELEAIKLGLAFISQTATF